MPEFDSLEAIAQSDALLDAIAGDRRFIPDDSDEQALVSLLEGWRDGVRRHPTDGVVTLDEAAAALQQGRVSGPARESKPSARRGLSLVASAAAAVLAIGGFGAVVAGSGPGDSMYGLKTALFGEKSTVRDDRVALAAQTEMAQVQQLIDNGDWERAQQKLEAVSTQVESVGDVGTKTDLIQQWNELSVKVGTRDAEASLPPVVPGEPAAPPPSGVTLLELPPPVTTTTTTSVTDVTTTTVTSGQTTTSAPATTSAPTTTSGPATTTAPVTTTSAAPATSATSSAPTTTVPTTTVPTTTVPTTTVPTTTVPTTTAERAATSTVPTTTAAAAVTTTAAPVATTTPAPQVTTTVAGAPAAAATTTVAGAPAQATTRQQEAQVVTTTAVPGN